MTKGRIRRLETHARKSESKSDQVDVDKEIGNISEIWNFPPPPPSNVGRFVAERHSLERESRHEKHLRLATVGLCNLSNLLKGN